MSKDRVMPQSPEIEQALLGALMFDPAKLALVRAILPAEAFYLDQHRLIYQSFCALADQQKQCDLPSALDEIKRQGLLDKCGGAGFLASLLGGVATSAHVEHHAEMVLEKHTQRRLIRTCTEIAEAGYSGELVHAELMDWAEKAIFDITRASSQSADLIPIGQSLAGLFEQTVEAHEWRKANANADGELPVYHSGLITGIPVIDEWIDGYQPESLNLIAGGPGVGKTALALNIAANIAARPEHKVVVFSLEMGAVAIARRIVAAHSEIPKKRIQQADMSDVEWRTFTKTTRYLSGNLIMIGDSAGLNVRQVAGTIRRNAENLKLVIVDSLNLMTAVGRFDNKAQAIASLSGGLKHIAMETGIPILAVCQLNREGMKQKVEPELSDLKDTSSLEYDADSVVTLFRDSKEMKEAANKPDHLRGVVNVYVKVAKSREGETGTKLMTFDKRIMKFSAKERD